MSNPQDNPDQPAEARNPDEEPPVNAPPLDPNLLPVYSMEGYPLLPAVDYNADLRQQAVYYNVLAGEVEERLRREMTAGRRRLEQMGMSQEQFRAQYGEEFQLYAFATSEHDCIVPGTQMSALYIEFIRIFIFLLYKESIHRENKEDRAVARALPSGTESQRERLVANLGAELESPEFSDSSASRTSTSGSSAVSRASGTSTSSSGDADNLPLHRDPALQRSSISSSLDSYNTGVVLARLDQFSQRLTLLDPSTVSFLGRLQGLIGDLQSRYSSAEESLEHTSADASNLGRESGNSNAEADRTGGDARPSRSTSYATCQVPSEDSISDIANLPEDDKPGDENRDEGGPPN